MKGVIIMFTMYKIKKLEKEYMELEMMEYKARKRGDIELSDILKEKMENILSKISKIK